MIEDDSQCKEHSGCMARIDSNEKETGKQWNVIGKIETRMNQILGAVVITLVAAIANLLVKIGG